MFCLFQNVLKILISYVGWSERWNEWIPANHKRIISKHKESFNSDESARAPVSGSRAVRRRAMLSAPPARCPFAGAGRIGVLVKTDLGNNEDEAMGLVRVSDPYTGLTCYLWLKLLLLRPIPTSPLLSSPPLFAGFHNTGVASTSSQLAVPYALSGITHFGTQMLASTFDEALVMGADITTRAVSSQAVSLLHQWLRRWILSTDSQPSPTAVASLFRSPSLGFGAVDEKAPVASFPALPTSSVFGQLLARFSIAELISVMPTVCGDVARYCLICPFFSALT